TSRGLYRGRYTSVSLCRAIFPSFLSTAATPSHGESVRYSSSSSSSSCDSSQSPAALADVSKRSSNSSTPVTASRYSGEVTSMAFNSSSKAVCWASSSQSTVLNVLVNAASCVVFIVYSPFPFPPSACLVLELNGAETPVKSEWAPENGGQAAIVSPEGKS